MSSTPVESKLHYVGITLLVAAGYFITGRLGILLEIPAGYGTPIWIPAGIALAALLLGGYRYWFGILLGSFATNLRFSDFSTWHSVLYSALIIPFLIACGAALQASVGRYVVTRFVPYPNPLYTKRSIILFAILSGPIGCLVNASTSNFVLWAFGIIPISRISITWLTWWAGDAIGVLVFTPLLLILFEKPAVVWRTRVISVALPLVILFVTVSSLFIISRKLEQNELKLNFDLRATALSQQIGNGFSGAEEALHFTQTFVATAHALDKNKFHDFVTPVLKHYSFIQAIEFLKKVNHAQRKQFEKAQQSPNAPDYKITELQNGQKTAAKSRSYYYPVTYVEPLKSNEKALGYDINSEALRKKALNKALSNNLSVASAAIQLVQNNQLGMLLMVPIYQKHQNITQLSLNERMEKLEDVVLCVIRINELLGQSLAGQDLSGVNILLQDQTDLNKPQILYQHGKNALAIFSFQKNYTFGTRHFALTISPNAMYWDQHRPWQAWGVLTGGLLIVSLLGCFLLIFAGQKASIQQIVDEQTIQLKKYVDELKERNTELDQFAYIASHDLKAPLRTIENAAQWIEEDMGKQLSPEVTENLALLKNRTQRMGNLIEGILNYSRVGRTKVELENIDVNIFLQDIINNLAVPAGFSVTIQNKMPQLMAPRVPLSQIFSNLIGNGIKYHHRKEGKITISVKEYPAYYEFIIADDGPGIAKEYHEKIFEIFQTLQSRDTIESTGIGLTIVKKIIEQQGGKVWVESELGHGSQFHFTWIKINSHEQQNVDSPPNMKMAPTEPRA